MTTTPHTPAAPADVEAVWEEQAETLFMAALGRAEHDLVTSDIARDLKVLSLAATAVGLPAPLLMTAIMASAAASVKDVLKETGWLVSTDPPRTDSLPEDVLRHARQTAEVLAQRGVPAGEGTVL